MYCKHEKLANKRKTEADTGSSGSNLLQSCWL